MGRLGVARFLKTSSHAVLAPDLDPLLSRVSRSFYLSLKILPKRTRATIAWAYLLARIPDSITDSNVSSSSDRNGVLNRFREQITTHTKPTKTVHIPELKSRQHSEEILFEQAPQLIARAQSELSVSDWNLVRDVLLKLLRAMETDLSAGTRFLWLLNELESDAYAYDAAGCVGEFWSQVTIRHCPRVSQEIAMAERSDWLVNSVHLGKALQWTNILRDVGSDLDRKRCYLPKDQCVNAGLSRVEDLLSLNITREFRSSYTRWIDGALAHAQCGVRYVLKLPFTEFRLRLAAIWPLLFAVETLILLQKRNASGGFPWREDLKISRFQVWKEIAISLLLVPLGRWLEQRLTKKIGASV